MEVPLKREGIPVLGEEVEPPPLELPPPLEASVPELPPPALTMADMFRESANIRLSWSGRQFNHNFSPSSVAFIHACVLAANRGDNTPNPANNEREFGRMIEAVWRKLGPRQPSTTTSTIEITTSVMHVPGRATKRRRKNK